MDALTGFLIAGVVVSGIINVAQAIGGIYWNAKIREAKDERIKGLQDQLQAEKDMSAPKLLEYQESQKKLFTHWVEDLQGQLNEEKEKVVTLEAEGEKAMEKLTESQERVNDLEKAIQEVEQDLKAAERLSRPLGRRFIRYVDAYHREVLGPIDLLPNLPEEEGESA